MEIKFKEVWEILSCNFWWTAPGPKGEAPLTTEEKKSLCGVITRDLKNLLDPESKHFQGEEYFCSLMAGSSVEGCEWTGLRSWLVAHDWFARNFKDGNINLIAQWVYLFSKARKMTYNALPREVKIKDVSKIMTEIMGSLPNPK